MVMVVGVVWQEDVNGSLYRRIRPRKKIAFGLEVSPVFPQKSLLCLICKQADRRLGL